jgi:hypothetical protein
MLAPAAIWSSSPARSERGAAESGPKGAAPMIKTAAEIKALQIAAGTYQEPYKEPPAAALSEAEATARYLERKLEREFTPRLRRYSSVSLLQRLQIKTRAVEHMGGKCVLCGYTKCMRALEFHHLDRHNKQFSISTFINAAAFRFSIEEVWNKVKEELCYCTLLCANCHREVEAGVTLLP